MNANFFNRNYNATDNWNIMHLDIIFIYQSYSFSKHLDALIFECFRNNSAPEFGCSSIDIQYSLCCRKCRHQHFASLHCKLVRKFKRIPQRTFLIKNNYVDKNSLLCIIFLSKIKLCKFLNYNITSIYFVIGNGWMTLVLINCTDYNAFYVKHNAKL